MSAYSTIILTNYKKKLWDGFFFYHRNRYNNTICTNIGILRSDMYKFLLNSDTEILAYASDYCKKMLTYGKSVVGPHKLFLF